MAPAVTVAPQGGPASTTPLLLPLLLVLPVPLLLLVLPVPLLLLVLPVPLLLLVLPVPLLLVLPLPLLPLPPEPPPPDEPDEELSSPKLPPPPGLEEHAPTSTTTPATLKTSDDLSLEIHT
jgi:hypothetical protein